MLSHPTYRRAHDCRRSLRRKVVLADPARVARGLTYCSRRVRQEARLDVGDGLRIVVEVDSVETIDGSSGHIAPDVATQYHFFWSHPPAFPTDPLSALPAL